MTMEPAKLHGRQKRHIEELKQEIAHCLEKELSLLADERRERAGRLGIHHVVARHIREP